MKWEREMPLDSECPHQFVDPARADALDVCLSDDLDEGSLCTPARLQEPRPKYALPELGYSEVD